MKTRTVFNFIAVLVVILASVGLTDGRAISAPSSEADQPDLTTMPAPIVKFPGLARPAADPDPDNVVPETSGAAGITHYMQTVNKSIALFSKDGTFTGQPLGTPQFSATFEQFWADANTATACDGTENIPGTHHGQANVIFDHKNGRWVVLDIAYADQDNGPYYLCFSRVEWGPAANTCSTR